MNRDKPMTVLLSGDGYADSHMVYDTAECPSCGYILDDDFDIDAHHEPYCPHCGQKLSWEFGKIWNSWREDDDRY